MSSSAADDPVVTIMRDGETSTPLTGVSSSLSSGAAAIPPQGDEPIATSSVALYRLASATFQSISSKTKQIPGWVRERSHSPHLLAVVSGVTNLLHKFASASATHLRDGWRWLLANARQQAETWTNAQGRLESALRTLRTKLARRRAVNSLTEVVSPPSHASSVAPNIDFATPREVHHVDFPIRREVDRDVESLPAGDIEVLSLRLATTVTSQVEEPMATSPTDSFVMTPLPWVLGALSPVISSRTMQMHRGYHHSQCIDLANRLIRSHKHLAGKSPLEIVRWAREHARGSELLAAASEAWNHSFYWQSLAPSKKRPRGELREALNREFGDFANFAEKFALAGATHVGSGWLWLVTNRRKQVRIMTTSDVDCLEARVHSCLLGIDLWEHAYYFDHQNRRREYLDAVIDRRLDWDFAEHRYRLVLERGTCASRETRSRRGAPKRGRYHKHRRNQVTSRE